MKKYLFAIVAGILPALATTNTTNAQSSNNMALSENPRVIKINSSVFPEVTSTTTADLSSVNSKALKDFRKSYKDATNETWAEISDGFAASFNSAGVKNVIYYNKRGHWSASLKSYSEDKLDKSVKDIVNGEYSDYKITFVQEIETNATMGIPTYIVHIENKTNLKLIRVSDGEMDVYQEFKKQP